MPISEEERCQLSLTPAFSPGQGVQQAARRGTHHRIAATDPEKHFKGPAMTKHGAASQGVNKHCYILPRGQGEPTARSESVAAFQMTHFHGGSIHGDMLAEKQPLSRRASPSQLRFKANYSQALGIIFLPRQVCSKMATRLGSLFILRILLEDSGKIL